MHFAPRQLELFVMATGISLITHRQKHLMRRRLKWGMQGNLISPPILKGSFTSFMKDLKPVPALLSSL